MAALLWPGEQMASAMRPGDTLATETVGWAKTDKSGRFRLEVVESRIPDGYVGADGQLDLMFVAWDGTSERTWMASTSGADAHATVAAPGAGRKFGRVRDDLRIELRGRLTATRTTDGSTGGRIRPENYPNPDSPGCYWSLYSNSDRRVTNDVAIYTYWERANIDWGASKTISVGSAINSKSTFGGFSFGGSIDRSQSTTFHPTAWQTEERLYSIEMRYGRYKEICPDLNGQPFTLRWAFEPIQATGSFSYVRVSYPTWCYDGGINIPDKGTWSRKISSGRTTKFSAGVKTAAIIGIDLPFEASYSNSSSAERMVNYNFFSLNAKMHLCGDNDDPLYASNVREGPNF